MAGLWEFTVGSFDGYRPRLATKMCTTSFAVETRVRLGGKARKSLTSVPKCISPFHARPRSGDSPGLTPRKVEKGGYPFHRAGIAISHPTPGGYCAWFGVDVFCATLRRDPVANAPPWELHGCFMISNALPNGTGIRIWLSGLRNRLPECSIVAAGR